MPSVWLAPYIAKDGSKRHRVRYRLGGRESRVRYAGSFATKRDALARKAWVGGELAAMRMPDLRLVIEQDPATVRTLAESWQAARVDVSARPRRPIASRSAG